jgi:aspartate ammonia-lyase
VTALVPYIGYDRAAEIGKKALQSNMTIKEVLVADKVLPIETIDSILNPLQLTKPGIAGK